MNKCMAHDKIYEWEESFESIDRESSEEWDNLQAAWRPAVSDIKALRKSLKDYVRPTDVEALAQRSLMLAFEWYFAIYAPAVYIRNKREDLDDMIQLAHSLENKLRVFSIEFDFVAGKSFSKYQLATGAFIQDLREIERRAQLIPAGDRRLICEAELLVDLFPVWKRYARKKSTIAGFERLLSWLFDWLSMTTSLRTFRRPWSIPPFKEHRSLRAMIERNRTTVDITDASMTSTVWAATGSPHTEFAVFSLSQTKRG